MYDGWATISCESLDLEQHLISLSNLKAMKNHQIPSRTWLTLNEYHVN